MRIVNGIPCRKAHFNPHRQPAIYPDYMLEPYTNEELRWMLREWCKKRSSKTKLPRIITLALLDSYEERKEKLGVITNLESRRQNNESKATD